MGGNPGRPFHMAMHFMQVPGLAEKLVDGRQSAYLGYFFRFEKFTPDEITHYLEAYSTDSQLHAVFEITARFQPTRDSTLRNMVPMTCRCSSVRETHHFVAGSCSGSRSGSTIGALSGARRGSYTGISDGSTTIVRSGLPICISALLPWIAHNSAMPGRFLARKQFLAHEAFANPAGHDQKWLANPVVLQRRCGLNLAVAHRLRSGLECESRTGGSGRRISIRFFYHAADACSRNPMLACNLRERHARAAVSHNLLAVDVEPSTTDLATFKPRSPHSGSDTLTDQIGFEFCN
jgi:hypothetical protein